MNKDQIEFNKHLNQHRKDSNVKLCLWGGEHGVGCSGKIIDAHSIQRGKILSEISNSGKIYHLGLMPSEDMSEMVSVFKLEGIGKFSTFKGFCGEHDKRIFQPIEDVPFSATIQQKNIYAYRAIAKELHANLISSEFCKNLLGEELHKDDFPPHFRATLPGILKGEIIVPEFIKKQIIESAKKDTIRTRYKQTNINVSELKIIESHLKSSLDNGVESHFEHIYYHFDELYPITCSSSFISYFDYKGNQLIDGKTIRKLANQSESSITDFKNVIINIFPEGGKTHIIFSCLKENSGFIESVNKLFLTETDYIKISISNILLNYVENIAFNPTYIDTKFSEEEKEQIKSTHLNNIIDTRVFTKSNINLFKI